MNGNDPQIPAPAGQLEEMTMPLQALAGGQALQRVGTPFVTAIAVQKPRSIDAIVAAMKRECEYGGASFYYSWSQSGKRIEDGSIGLAQSIAREWGNNAVTVAVEESDEAFMITPRFIDLEKGSQTERVFRQRKSGAVHGKHDPERKLDIALQIGQSKAIRNVIKQGVPRWLWDDCVKAAKVAVAEDITKEGIDKARESTVKAFDGSGISVERLISKIGKPLNDWTSHDLADLKGDAEAIRSGEMSKSDLFPEPEREGPAPKVEGKGQGTAPKATKVETPGEETPKPPAPKPQASTGVDDSDFPPEHGKDGDSETEPKKGNGGGLFGGQPKK